MTNAPTPSTLAAEAGVTTEPIVRIENVSKIYRSGDDTVTALSPTDLAIAEGEFIVLLGPSGCGKTTLLRLVAGLISPSTGRIDIRSGDHPPAGREGAHLGMVFQEASLFPWLNIEDNVALPMQLAGHKAKERRKRARELCKLVGLEGFEKRWPRELSGGMQQRAAIARALCADPAILLMDEPFGALDAFTRDRLNLELQDIWLKTGKTVVLVTHSISEAVFLADRTVVLSPRPGRVVAVEDIGFERPRTLELQATPEFQDRVLELRRILGQV
ncbi:NitT/TauT family transport system ATP-binding protein [Pseudonocardia thermophila]|jgi:ABC-type nitrate/sulfonate/bicarbonate transport system, ATPase component|uniref:NitT/TauT family transport system ATP-binding protein n=1 Tax=Pseudonocardia thermophila TaxID=1848 RepID=A0A1M6N3M6_PSETH|nr:ABC transporter ATP-binding protein [Pseudonocardia thermophila]SHJ90266.1 NitT/TauT family transport system ATP-binding protein [Pseudonocardia thermophila]